MSQNSLTRQPSRDVINSGAQEGYSVLREETQKNTQIGWREEILCLKYFPLHFLQDYPAKSFSRRVLRYQEFRNESNILSKTEGKILVLSSRDLKESTKRIGKNRLDIFFHLLLYFFLFLSFHAIKYAHHIHVYVHNHPVVPFRKSGLARVRRIRVNYTPSRSSTRKLSRERRTRSRMRSKFSEGENFLLFSCFYSTFHIHKPT